MEYVDIPSVLLGTKIAKGGVSYERRDVERSFLSASPVAGGESVADLSGAVVKAIRGNTVVWNQMVENGNFASISYWLNYASRGTSAASDNVLTYTKTSASGVDSVYRQNIPYVTGHKYLATIEANPSVFIKGYLTCRAAYFTGVGLTAMTDIAANTWSRISGIGEYSSSYTDFAFGTSSANYLPQGETVKLRNAMLIDLTELFGAGKEPSTVEEFRAMFPLDYYAYNEGEPLNFTGTAIAAKKDGAVVGSVTLPIAEYFPDGMRSAGGVCDTLTADKATQRIDADGTVLETPIETPIDPPLVLSYVVTSGGTEEIVQPAGTPPTSSPIDATVTYTVEAEETP